LNPVIIFSGIAKVPGAYLAACGVFRFLIAVGSVVQWVKRTIAMK
jgi:hypothetical protein